LRSHVIAALLLFATVSATQAEPPQIADVATWPQPDHLHTRFTLITEKGFVGFTVGGNWAVIAMQSHMPVAVAAFQIPDGADAGTQDSTNFAIQLLQPDSERGKAMIAHDDAKHAAAGAVQASYSGWTTYTYTSNQGPTAYTVMDARGSKADVICGVRLSWSARLYRQLRCTDANSVSHHSRLD
jgi:hypothetical protein